MLTRDRQAARLLGVSAALAGVVAVELIAGPFFVPEEPEYRAAAEASTDVPVLLPRDKPDIADFSEIAARPLFSPTRRPKEGVDAEGPAVARADAFDLIGVIIEPQGRTALLQPKPAGKVIRVVEGQKVEGWDVRDIKPTQITLGKANGKDHIITISDKPRKLTGNRIQAIQASTETIDQGSSEDEAAGASANDGDEATALDDESDAAADGSEEPEATPEEQ
jgi:hypothetical protein